MIKFLILIGFAILGGAVGWRISDKIVQKRKYFEDLCYLLNSISCDMRFKQTQLLRLLDEYAPKHGALRTNVDEFSSYATGKESELKLSRRDLSEREHKFIIELFSTLGRYDLSTQMLNLEALKVKAEEFFMQSKIVEEKQSLQAKKLGVMLGLLVGVLVL